METISRRIKLAMSMSTALLLFVAPVLVSANRYTVSANDLSKYLIDARDVSENLDDYQALWIKIHGCV
jgi:hypothetical protein